VKLRRRRRGPRRDLAFGVVVMLAVAAVLLPVAFWLFGRDDKVPTYGPSMYPTLRGSAPLDVDFDAYDRGSPRVGDIVVLQGPVEIGLGSCSGGRPARSPCPTPSHDYGDEYLVKRIVAGPGDTVAIARDGGAVVNGARAAEPYIRRCRRFGTCALPRPIEVPPAHYFVLGDNRPRSTDSRDWGPVSADAIDGRVVLDN
jgi:signal peptidase I